GVRLSSATAGNRHGVGARVRLDLEGGSRPSLVSEIHGGNGYLGSSDFGLHFGIEKGAKPTGAEVTWPGGQTEHFTIKDAAWQTLVQGQGQPR
ncbi:MAG: ASPIC/UnbV domain-containing protein, partial [Planctomycetes bacterium]|nr:ASPIC/UnbV domain-containing protein [Planctomycetota bacterium]